MALFPGFFRKGWYVPAGLSAAALFYNPELLLHSVKPQYMLAVSAGSVGFLALALMLFDFRRLAGAVASMKREAQLALGGFFCIAAGHFFLNGRYPFDALGESLVWILLPLAAYVYYDAFRFFLPRALALLGLWDLAVSGIQYHSGAMIFFFWFPCRFSHGICRDCCAGSAFPRWRRFRLRGLFSDTGSGYSPHALRAEPQLPWG